METAGSETRLGFGPRFGLPAWEAFSLAMAAARSSFETRRTRRNAVLNRFIGFLGIGDGLKNESFADCSDPQRTAIFLIATGVVQTDRDAAISTGAPPSPKDGHLVAEVAGSNPAAGPLKIPRFAGLRQTTPLTNQQFIRNSSATLRNSAPQCKHKIAPQMRP